jgi:3-hydroxymyristoyl/3-hydroxydecanoyl-(acyl carrier protein) dehydratase
VKAAGFESVQIGKVIETTEKSLVLEFSVPASSGYFDGHFPEFNILPAVAQTELVIRLASRYLKTGGEILEIRRVKFSNLIRPGIPLLLRLERDGGLLVFKISSPEGDTVFSSGTMALKESS